MGRLQVVVGITMGVLWGCESEITPTELSTVELTDDHNYSYVPSVDIEAYEVSELSDVVIDWSGLTTDMYGQPLDPAGDIDMISLMVFTYLDHDEVEAAMFDGSLTQAEMGLYLFAETGGETSWTLGGLTLFGTDVDVETYFEADYGESWLISLSTGTMVGAGTRTTAFLDPVADATTSEAHLHDGSTVLEVDADLGAAQTVYIPPHTPFHVDWSGVTTNGRGDDIGNVLEVLILGFGSTGAAELQERVPELAALADWSWRTTVPPGTTALDLAECVDGDGDGYAGVAPVGTWLIVLQTREGHDPTPAFVAEMVAGSLL